MICAPPTLLGILRQKNSKTKTKKQNKNKKTKQKQKTKQNKRQTSEQIIKKKGFLFFFKLYFTVMTCKRQKDNLQVSRVWFRLKNIFARKICQTLRRVSFNSLFLLNIYNLDRDQSCLASPPPTPTPNKKERSKQK